MHPQTLIDPADFAWSDAFLLGFNEMDHTHEEFVQVVREMLDCDASDFADRLDAFIAHAERHFGEEENWMNETEFPARECHINEHAAVMKSALEVRKRVCEGDAAVGLDFAEELTRWFPGHTDYLDSALAAWMVKRRHGGRPVVLRRSIG
jgi:hemerythrin